LVKSECKSTAGESAPQDCPATESNTCPDLARLAACTEALDNSDSRTTKLHRLEENIGATAVELTSGDLREIDTAASNIEVRGARLPEAALQMTGR
jgi:hypothetical protein